VGPVDGGQAGGAMDGELVNVVVTLLGGYRQALVGDRLVGDGGCGRTVVMLVGELDVRRGGRWCRCDGGGRAVRVGVSSTSTRRDINDGIFAVPRLRARRSHRRGDKQTGALSATIVTRGGCSSAA